MRVNKQGYLDRCVVRGSRRDWWLVKYSSNTISCKGVVYCPFGNVSVPKEFIGKRVRFKIEVVDDGS